MKMQENWYILINTIDNKENAYDCAAYERIASDKSFETEEWVNIGPFKTNSEAYKYLMKNEWIPWNPLARDAEIKIGPGPGFTSNEHIKPFWRIKNIKYGIKIWIEAAKRNGIARRRIENVISNKWLDDVEEICYCFGFLFKKIDPEFIIETRNSKILIENTHNL